MKRVSYLLAWRYLLGSAYETTISTMARICFLGILIGSFALALVSAVMHGFEVTIHEKMQGVHAQVIIRAYGNTLDIDALGTVLRNSFPEIKAFSPTTMQHAIVQGEEEDCVPIVVILKGIVPELEAKVSTLEQKIKPINQTQPKLIDLVQDNKVIIGKTLANDLGIKQGDQIQLLYTEDMQSKRKKISMAKEIAIVSGTFNTGIDEFDSAMIICSLDFVQQLFPESGITQLNIKLKPQANEKVVISHLQDKLKLEAYSWKDLYPALVSALKLEKYAMFLILALITLVASMSIISLLFMQITQKRTDIAILRAMGASYKLIEHIFLLMGMVIASIASAFGILLAWLTSIFLENYPFIKLPDVYYASHLPAKMEWSLVVTVFTVVMVLSFFATWLTARQTRSINIAEVLRFEG